MSRVAEIRDRIVPATTGGDFAAHLQRQLERPAPTQTVEPVLERHVVSSSDSSGFENYLHTHHIKGRNGRLEGTGLLVEVSGAWHGNGQLLAPAAAAWEDMRAAAAADGVDLRAIDMYRNWDVQAAAYQAFLDGRKKANVLPPGKSEHGNGLAVDITNGSLVGPGDPEWHWLTQNATRFGWHPISNESWHWEFRGR